MLKIWIFTQLIIFITGKAKLMGQRFSNRVIYELREVFILQIIIPGNYRLNSGNQLAELSLLVILVNLKHGIQYLQMMENDLRILLRLYLLNKVRG